MMMLMRGHDRGHDGCTGSHAVLSGSCCVCVRSAVNSDRNTRGHTRAAVSDAMRNAWTHAPTRATSVSKPQSACFRVWTPRRVRSLAGPRSSVRRASPSVCRASVCCADARARPGALVRRAAAHPNRARGAGAREADPLGQASRSTPPDCQRAQRDPVAPLCEQIATPVLPERGRPSSVCRAACLGGSG